MSVGDFIIDASLKFSSLGSWSAVASVHVYIYICVCMCVHIESVGVHVSEK